MQRLLSLNRLLHVKVCLVYTLYADRALQPSDFPSRSTNETVQSASASEEADVECEAHSIHLACLLMASWSGKEKSTRS
jgi:hypothetical protein